MAEQGPASCYGYLPVALVAIACRFDRACLQFCAPAVLLLLGALSVNAARRPSFADLLADRRSAGPSYVGLRLKTSLYYCMTSVGTEGACSDCADVGMDTTGQVNNCYGCDKDDWNTRGVSEQDRLEVIMKLARDKIIYFCEPPLPFPLGLSVSPIYHALQAATLGSAQVYGPKDPRQIQHRNNIGPKSTVRACLEATMSTFNASRLHTALFQKTL